MSKRKIAEIQKYVNEHLEARLNARDLEQEIQEGYHN